MSAVVISASEPGALRRAALVIQRGGVVAYPTETFYALGAAYDNEAALMRIVQLKHRPEEKALPLIIGSREMLGLIAEGVSAEAEGLMRAHWPGPLTLVLSARPELSALVTVRGTVAVRMPGLALAREISMVAGLPVTSTSANPSGESPACTASQVVEWLGRELDLVLDGGVTPGGLASTVVDVTGEGLRIIRRGAIELG